jgi:uncharacterized membrane protein
MSVTVIAHSVAAPHKGRHAVETLIAHLLFWGGALSIVIVLSGLVLHAARGGFDDHAIELHRVAGGTGQAHPREVFVSLSEVARGLDAHPMRPTAVIALGLTLLLMTPVVGVVVAIAGFLAARDYRYAIIATSVFALLVLGMTMAGGIG